MLALRFDRFGDSGVLDVASLQGRPRPPDTPGNSARERGTRIITDESATEGIRVAAAQRLCATV